MDEKALLSLDEFEAAKKYWLEKLAGSLEELRFYRDFPTGNVYQKGALQISLQPELAKKLIDISGGQNLTLYILLLTVYKIMLYKYTGQAEIMVGSPVYTTSGETYDFNKCIALRDFLSSKMTFKGLLNTIKQTIVEGYKNQHYPFEKILTFLELSAGEIKLFKTIFLLENIHQKEPLTGLIFSPANEITLSLNNTGQGIEGWVFYNAAAFREATVRKMVEYYEYILRQVLADTSITLGQIEIISEADQRLIMEFNQTENHYHAASIIELFEEQAAKTPSRIAVVYPRFKSQAAIENETLTYSELNRRSNQLAGMLQKAGVKADTIVGLLVERSLEMAIGIWGILKAGGAYLPIDPEYPDRRINRIIADSQLEILLTHSHLKNKIREAVQIIELDREELYRGDDSNPKRTTSGDDLAYVIYTSGSSGEPKGVMIEHRSLVNFINWRTQEYGFGVDDATLQLISVSFDGFGTNFYSSLVTGGKLVIPDQGRWMDFNYIKDLIPELGITNMSVVPPMYGAILENATPAELKTLRFIILAAEKPGKALLKLHQSLNLDIELINEYGPTESTITTAALRGMNEDNISVIGTPIANQRILIMNDNNNMMPLGVPGELCIFGEGLARGYLNRPELTAEKFVSNPFFGGSNGAHVETLHASPPLEGQSLRETAPRIYRTGDLARWLPDGKLELLDRIDNQIKIRGNRVELGEIEATLLKHDRIKEAAVVWKEYEHGDKYLAAYFTAYDEIGTLAMREYLALELPDYMIPPYIIQLDKMPVTSNGKIDRKALPAPGLNLSGGAEYEAPGDNLEAKLCEMWQGILELEKVGINDNFFLLGGHSLRATTLMYRIRKELNLDISLEEIFKEPTIKGLAAVFRQKGYREFQAIEPAKPKEYYPSGYYPTSSAQKRMYILQQLDPQNTVYNMPQAVWIEGKMDRAKFESAINELIHRHEALRTWFDIGAGEPVQRIHPEVKWAIEYQEVDDGVGNEGSDDGVGNGHARSVPAIIQEFIRPFDLKEAPLLRVGLFRVRAEKHLMLIDLHHIISDDISNNLLLKEFFEIYQGKSLPELRIQYKDYAVWQNNLLETGAFHDQENYWLETFAEGIPTLHLPLDQPRDPGRIYQGKVIEFRISKELTRQLESLAQKLNITLNMALFSVYSLLLGKYSDQKDLVIGSLVSGRHHADLENMAGVFINFLPIRIKIEKDCELKDFLSSTGQLILKAYKNQDYPFDKLVEKLTAKLNHTRNPLFDTMFIFHNQYEQKLAVEVDGLKLAGQAINRGTANLDIKLGAVLVDEELRFILEYNTHLFQPETMERLIGHFKNLIETTVCHPEKKLSGIELFTEAQRREINQKRLKSTGESVQLAIAATFTAESVANYIKWWLQQFKIDTAIQFASYNQVFQELLDPLSLISQNQGLNLILVRFEDWIRNDSASDEEKSAKLEQNLDQLLGIITAKGNSTTYFIGLFPVSDRIGLSAGMRKQLKALNLRWKKALESMAQVVVLDFTILENSYLVTEVFDVERDQLGHIPFTEEYFAAMGTMIARKIYAWQKQEFKVIVLDCDHTLWRGICGEDGALGVTIDEPFLELQRLMLQKYKEGFLLAVCSKNNESDVWEVFTKNRGMLLKKEHFVAWRINWGPKSENLREIALELNLGLDSLIYIDDSPVECSEVMTHCPEALTLQLPDDYRQIPLFLEHIWAFDRLKITTEDKNRSQMYLAERRRQDIQKEGMSLTDFLKGLELELSMRVIDRSLIARVSQLTQRTNQFNLSTIRRTENEIQELLETPGVTIYGIEVRDRFGGYGLVGVVITKEQGRSLTLDTFLLSCRVLGRGIETAILARLGQLCRAKGITLMEACYYPTSKNALVLDFINQTQWLSIETAKEYTRYELAVEQIPEKVDYVAIYDGFPASPEVKESVAAGIENVGERQRTPEAAEYGEQVAKTAPKKAVHFNNRWETNIGDTAQLKHANHLLPLKYYSGAQLLDLPLSGGAPQEIYQKEYEAPRDQTEQKLVAIWQKILRIDRIGINDDFFKLGGHSLNATTLSALIHKEFDVQMSLLEIFNAHTIKGLSKLIQHARQSEFVPIETVEKRGYYPTSSAQKRLFIVSQIEKKSTGYNIPGAVLIQGALDKKLVQQVFLKLIKRHETLRTSFEIIDGQPVSRVHPEIDFQIAYWDEADPVRNGHDDEGADSKPRVQKIIRDFIRPFNLQEAPLMRVGLLRLENGDHLLLYDLHHIITDGISMNILVNEFAELYAGRTLPELRVQYKDYSVWQRRRLETEEIKEQEEYWIGKFQGDIPVLNLPTDFGRPAIQSFEGGRITFSLDEEITRKIKALGRVTGATLYMVLLALYNVLLMKYTEQEEIVVGTPIAGRSRADLENIIGMFVNTLALKNHPGPHQTFTEFLNQVKENALAAFANQDYQFEELVEKLDLKRDISRNPLFDVMFVLQNPTDTEVKLAGLNLSIYEIPDQTSRFDLTLRVIETGAGLSVNFEYCSKLWRRETIERMGTHFRNLVSDALVNPNLSLADIRLLTQDEQRRLLVDFNQTVSEYPKEKSLVELFEARAGKNPDQVAVVSGAEQITYSVLNGKANQIARMLRNLGLKENCIAGILLEPSIEMVLAILGILKAGGAYLPIETTLPPERINYILEDSGAGILLTQANRLPQIEFRGKAIDIADAEIYEQADSNFEPVSTAKDLVYVIYTSGTTGRPKGVLLEHQSLVNYVTWFSGLNDLAQTDKTMLLASPCYDLGYTSLYPALAQGCELHIVAKELYSNPARVLSYIRQHEITYLKMTPSLFNVIVNSTSFSTPGICATLRLLVLGGEKINVADLETYHQRYPQTVIMNHYGPTETTIGSVALKIDFTEFEKYQEHPVIGRPINNTGVYILDRQMQPTPMGVRGEIYISGAGLARGYLNRPELTAEKFVPIPFGGGTYRTGDLARYLPDGGIEYFGRTDHQVKIRGYRVEPGEIERTVLKHGSVKEAVVEVKTAKNDTKFLCLYVVTAGGLKASEIKEYLSQKLPDYLIPAFIIPMEAFPLTGNGKIDRRRLPDPDQESNRGAAYEAPRNNTEQALVEIWQGVLGVDHIGISDNFFDLGGHSLNGAILISRIQMEFKVDIPLSELFKTPTVKGLVAYITKADQSIYASIQPAPAQEHYRVSSAQKRMYLSYQLNPLSTAYNTPAAVMMDGKLAKESLERAFAELIKRHETLRTSFGLIAGEPVQVVHDQAPFQIQYHEADEAELKDVTNAFIKPFDLTRAPLLRVHLIKLKAQERYLLFMDMHHIVFDGVSRSLLISEFMELYRGKVLPDLKIQYKDFSEWQNDMVAAGMIKKQEEYWLQKLSGEIPALNMPTDYPRPAVKSFAGEELFATVEKELTQKINTLAKETGATLFMVLMAAYNILLSKYSGQEDIIVGAPVAGRPHVDLERIIGVFINTLALRNYPNRNKSIREFIAEVKLTTLDALENQDCQFERLVERLDVARDSSRNPLFDTMFIMQNIAFPNLTIDNLEFKPYNCARKDAKFDFKLEAYENNGIIGLKLDYATQVYKQETMERFLRHFIHLLEQMVQNPEAQIGSLEILTVDRGEIISNFNDDLENDYSFATYN